MEKIYSCHNVNKIQVKKLITVKAINIFYVRLKNKFLSQRLNLMSVLENF
jgi:hypothetical protein